MMVYSKNSRLARRARPDYLKTFFSLLEHVFFQPSCITTRRRPRLVRIGPHRIPPLVQSAWHSEYRDMESLPGFCGQLGWKVLGYVQVKRPYRFYPLHVRSQSVVDWKRSWKRSGPKEPNKKWQPPAPPKIHISGLFTQTKNFPSPKWGKLTMYMFLYSRRDMVPIRMFGEMDLSVSILIWK